MLNEKFLLVFLLFLGATKIDCHEKHIVGRLLTVDEKCGLTNVKHNKIVGGKLSKYGNWPWIALLGEQIKGFRKTNVLFSCGGTLLTSKHVVSAAHCFGLPGKPKINLDIVRLGEFDLKSTIDRKHVDIPIDHVDVHKDFDTFLVFYTHDIAMVHLSDHVKEFTEFIRPICLPTKEQMQTSNLDEASPFVAGWGLLREAGKQSDALQELQIPIIKNHECKQKYRKLYPRFEIPDSRMDGKKILCAGYAEGGKDTCQGDSGGPMMMPLRDGKGGFPFHLIGIVSSGLGCAREGVPGMYTNLEDLVEWNKRFVLLKIEDISSNSPVNTICF